jgi:hypothetical protein
MFRPLVFTKPPKEMRHNCSEKLLQAYQMITKMKKAPDLPSAFPNLFVTKGSSLHLLDRRRQETFALQALAGQLAGTADGLGLFARLLFRRLFVVAAQFHLTEDSLALHLLLQGAQGLINIIIADENLHGSSNL